MDTYCRFCGEERENLSPIDNLNVLIMLWLRKIINFDDTNFPKNLCYTCLCTIEDIHFFLEKCSKSYKKFEDILINKNGNSEPKIQLELEVKDEMYEEYLTDSEFYNEENSENSQINCPMKVNSENSKNDQSLVFQEFQEEILGNEKLRRTYKCSICYQEFNTNKAKSIHFTTHVNDENYKKYNYKCRFCTFECNDREKVAYHMKRDHLNNNKNALFKDLLAIVIDQRNIEDNNESKEPTELNSIIADETEMLYEGKLEVSVDKDNIDYIKLLNLADVYECKICKINFSKKTSFNKHWDALHLSEEEKELKKQRNKIRDQHLCSECGKRFSSAFKLEYHIRMHRNDRQYKCLLCSKSYISKSHLETHMNRHTGKETAKMYSCEMCEKKCRTPSELKIHQRFHRNERPFKCEFCERSFHLKSHLQSHVKGHLNEPTYVCSEPGCVQSYRDKNAFRRHKDSHLPDEDKNYECDICTNKFSTFGIMKDHRRKSHSRKHKQNPLNENSFIII